MRATSNESNETINYNSWNNTPNSGEEVRTVIVPCPWERIIHQSHGGGRKCINTQIYCLGFFQVRWFDLGFNVRGWGFYPFSLGIAPATQIKTSSSLSRARNANLAWYLESKHSPCCLTSSIRKVSGVFKKINHSMLQLLPQYPSFDERCGRSRVWWIKWKNRQKKSQIATSTRQFHFNVNCWVNVEGKFILFNKTIVYSIKSDELYETLHT